jgi:hypothetical protein
MGWDAFYIVLGIGAGIWLCRELFDVDLLSIIPWRKS